MNDRFFQFQNGEYPQELDQLLKSLNKIITFMNKFGKQHTVKPSEQSEGKEEKKKLESTDVGEILELNRMFKYISIQYGAISWESYDFDTVTKPLSIKIEALLIEFEKILINRITEDTSSNLEKIQELSKDDTVPHFHQLVPKQLTRLIVMTSGVKAKTTKKIEQ